MTDPTIRAALEAAVDVIEEPTRPVSTKKHAAEIIAAFLRHFTRGQNLHSFTLPDAWGGPGGICIRCQQLDALAAAVEAAAKEPPRDAG
jgi:hypothetical protein